MSPTSDNYSPAMQAKVAAMLAELTPEELLALVHGARVAGDPGRSALLAELKTRVSPHNKNTPTS